MLLTKTFLKCWQTSSSYWEWTPGGSTSPQGTTILLVGIGCSALVAWLDRRGLGAVHNCQYLNECTKHSLSQTPPPLPQKMYTSTFFKWIICHEFLFLKVYRINFFFHWPLLKKSMFCTLSLMLTIMDGPLAIWQKLVQRKKIVTNLITYTQYWFWLMFAWIILKSTEMSKDILY